MQHSSNSQDVNSAILLAMTEGEDLTHDQMEWIWRKAWPLVKIGEVEPGKLAVLVAASKLLHLSPDALQTDETHLRVEKDAARIHDKAAATLLRMTGRLQ